MWGLGNLTDEMLTARREHKGLSSLLLWISLEGVISGDRVPALSQGPCQQSMHALLQSHGASDATAGRMASPCLPGA